MSAPNQNTQDISKVTQDIFLDTQDMIHTYTRQDALTDGPLIDVSDQAKRLGYRYPVALSEGIANYFVGTIQGTSEGNTHKFLSAALVVIETAEKNLKKPSDRIWIEVEGESLWCVCSGDGNGNPVLTFCFPEEV